ncbi:MAG: DUF4386 domain-containing protein [Ilumatobacter sp.]|uniref:DUF4386 domain-containing protein n=1 Tax=Ilumatobacter sp. TaxID=1967498 RepID=UPI00262F3088|nr:DUF4386 domain-containing protein [Ilumatobacter sp.]MDJ0768161.1 DUF4386 domain-containing protein [Ilumatobacter sp.]
MSTDTIDTPAADRITAHDETTDHDPASVKRKARLAGLLYLAIFIIAPFAFFVVPGRIVVDDDVAATAANIVESEGLFRAGMVAETIIIAIELVLAGLLYALLRPVSRPLSLAAAFARVGEAIVQAVNLFTSGVVLLIATGTGYLAVFEPDQRDALTSLFVDVNQFGVVIWGLLFGFHLALLGYLIHRSGFWPRVIGALIMVASVGYLAQSYAHIVAPEHDAFFETFVVALAAPGELAFTIWLLWKGIDVRRWYRRSSQSLPV